MGDAPYTGNPANVRRFLQRIPQMGVPDKVTIAYLASVGFTSSNDRSLPKVLQQLGLVDGSKVPTETWLKMRDRANGPKVLAEAIRESYDDLFKVYPEAHKESMDVIRNFFSANSKAGDAVIGRMAKTFEYVCELADFEGTPAVQEEQQRQTHMESAPVAQIQGDEGHPVREFKGEGVWIQIVPTEENIEEAIGFLEIYKKRLTKSAS